MIYKRSGTPELYISGSGVVAQRNVHKVSNLVAFHESSLPGQLVLWKILTVAQICLVTLTTLLMLILKSEMESSTYADLFVKIASLLGFGSIACYFLTMPTRISGGRKLGGSVKSISVVASASGVYHGLLMTTFCCIGLYSACIALTLKQPLPPIYVASLVAFMFSALQMYFLLNIRSARF